MAARKLVKANGFDKVIEVICSKVEEIPEGKISEKVDTIISEPLGTYLLNERMLETYIIARDRFLKPGGRMMPTSANLCIMPFSDPLLFSEQQRMSEFWLRKDLYGLNLSCLKNQAALEKL